MSHKHKGKTRKLVLIVGMTALFGLILNENVRMIGNSMKAGIFTGQIRSAYKAETLESDESELLQGLYAKAAVLMDGDSGRVLFDKNGEVSLPNASTTKIMTCILALENGHMDDLVNISAYADSMPEVAAGLEEGEQYYLQDLLYSMMLESHNDTAAAIAEHIGGSAEAFADMMNEKAAQIGCTGTFFVTPNGLDAQAEDENGQLRSHSTTAKDLALIMRYCITQSPKKDDFIEITTTENYTVKSQNSGRIISCYNRNSFLNMMDGASSGKTGYTGRAGYCYVGSLNDSGRTFIVALLACGWPNHKNYKWQDTKKLMTYGIENYYYRNLLKACELSPAEVSDGISASGQLYDAAYVPVGIDSSAGQGLQFLMKDDEEIDVAADYERTLDAPVYQGQRIGTAVYAVSGWEAAQFPIITTGSVQKADFGWYCLKTAEKLISEVY